jgi:hypothetical protein
MHGLAELLDRERDGRGRRAAGDDVHALLSGEEPAERETHAIVAGAHVLDAVGALRVRRPCHR